MTNYCSTATGSASLQRRCLASCPAASHYPPNLLMRQRILAKFLDVNMMVLLSGGCERTEAEFRSLFEAAGFQLTEIVATPSKMVSVIEAIRV